MLVPILLSHLQTFQAWDSSLTLRNSPICATLCHIRHVSLTCQKSGPMWSLVDIGGCAFRLSYKKPSLVCH